MILKEMNFFSKKLMREHSEIKKNNYFCKQGKSHENEQ